MLDAGSPDEIGPDHSATARVVSSFRRDFIDGGRQVMKSERHRDVPGAERSPRADLSQCPPVCGRCQSWDRLKQRGARLDRAPFGTPARARISVSAERLTSGRASDTNSGRQVYVRRATCGGRLADTKKFFDRVSEGGGVEISGAGGDRRHQAGGLREDLAGEEAGRHNLLVEKLDVEAAAVCRLQRHRGDR